MKMETRYETLLDQLHTNKREVTNYRQKYLNMESQLLSLQQTNRTIKKSLALSQENNQKLTEQNKFLLAQKENLQSEYTTSVQSIKDQISKKQLQIYALKQNSVSPLMNNRLLEKQIKCEVQMEFRNLLQSKDKKIKELQQQLEKSSFEREIDVEKYQLKISTLQKQLKQRQNQHMAELQTYVQRTYQNSQFNKVSEEQVLIRKLRREIDELRLTLDHTQQQLNDSINEKGKIQKQYSSLLSKHNLQIQKYTEQLRAIQFQNAKNSNIDSKNKYERNDSIIRNKEKELRNLKDKNEDLQEKLNKKETKISQLQVQLVARFAEINKIKEYNSQNENERIGELKVEKERLQREMKELKYTIDIIRKQNIELLSSPSPAKHKNINSITNEKRKLQILPESQLNNQDIPSRQFDSQNNASFMKSPQPKGLNRVRSTINFDKENDSKQKYVFLLEQEKLKNSQLSHKYVQLKKKYKNLQTKLQQANAKLVNLLKDKIQLTSPTAASKKSFNFPTSPNNSPSFRQPQENLQFNRFSQTMQIDRSNINMVSGVAKKRFSPKNQVQKAQLRDKQSKEKELSFYQKSLRVRSSHKFKEIKCLNHDDPLHDHRNCGHSPLPK